MMNWRFLSVLWVCYCCSNLAMIAAISCYCNALRSCGNKTCTEEGGACHITTERVALTNQVFVMYGCLREKDLIPRGRPFVCEETKVNDVVKVNCCEDADYCNNDLEVLELPTAKSPGFTIPDRRLKVPDIAVGKEQLTIMELIIIIGASIGCFILISFTLGIVLFKHRQKKNTLIGNSPDASIPDVVDTQEGEMQGWTTSGSGAGLPLLVHRTIARQVDLRDIIGQGRFGKVFMGTWRGENVAVKKFTSPDEGSWTREAEIYQTAMLRHENILGFIAADNKDVGVWTEFWLVTEYHENGSLYDYLCETRVDVPAMFKLASSIACGLTHLHMEIYGTRGKPPIAHRDLKSKNILVKKNGECCIADLGLAVRFNTTTGQMDIPFNNKQGTRRYMAPEVISNNLNVHHFDAFTRADIYSLGLVFWEIARRCNVNGQDLEYQMPYYDCVPEDPTLEDMHLVVCQKKRRPLKEDSWDAHESLLGMWNLMRECWHDNESARLPALRIKKTISRLQAEEFVKV